MKIVDKLKLLLAQNGLFDSQIEEIMTAEMSDPRCNHMRGRWQEDESVYPEMMMGILWLNVKVRTLAYIKENCPEAWFRPIFEDDNAVWSTPEGKAAKNGVHMHPISEELKDHVNPNEWDIVQNTDGDYSIIDQSIQTAIASGPFQALDEYRVAKRG